MVVSANYQFIPPPPRWLLRMTILIPLKVRRMLWSILAFALLAYLGICLFFWITQRSFIYMPRPETADHARAISLQQPDATLRISQQLHAGQRALLYFGGNAEDVAFAVPELAAAFPDRERLLPVRERRRRRPRRYHRNRGGPAVPRAVAEKSAAWRRAAAS